MSKPNKRSNNTIKSAVESALKFPSVEMIKSEMQMYKIKNTPKVQLVGPGGKITKEAREVAKRAVASFKKTEKAFNKSVMVKKTKKMTKNICAEMEKTEIYEKISSINFLEIIDKIRLYIKDFFMSPVRVRKIEEEIVAIKKLLS